MSSYRNRLVMLSGVNGGFEGFLPLKHLDNIYAHFQMQTLARSAPSRMIIDMPQLRQAIIRSLRRHERNAYRDPESSYVSFRQIELHRRALAHRLWRLD